MINNVVDFCRFWGISGVNMIYFRQKQWALFLKVDVMLNICDEMALFRVKIDYFCLFDLKVIVLTPMDVEESLPAFI
jgi:hypothetical protein